MSTNEFYDYLMVEFNSGVKLCKAPLASLVKAGDLVEAKYVQGKGKVLAVETASKSNHLFNLLDKINSPEKDAFKVDAFKVKTIYSKKEIEWKDEENDQLN